MKELEEIDQALAQDFGNYASYATAVDPVKLETYGDGPAEEMDRLLDRYAKPGSQVLDLGCGAGFTLCRLAPKVALIWGFDQDERLMAAARLRAAEQNLSNVRFTLGNAAVPADADHLPDDSFDLVFSRRGPNVNAFVKKLKKDGIVVQELFQGHLGLLETLGRKSFLSDLGDNPRWLIDEYSWLNLFPVSIKEYYFDTFFKDIDHLAAYLSQKTALYSWPMPPMPYQEPRDRAALELYARYNTTDQGIRIINVRKVYVFRRTPVQYAPMDPGVQPKL
jgi:SAM-dependent methyltransferase